MKNLETLVEQLGEVKLRSLGRSALGLCPFHKDVMPSFHVVAERDFYHCFGCHVSGNAAKFEREIKNQGGPVRYSGEEAQRASEREEAHKRWVNSEEFKAGLNEET